MPEMEISYPISEIFYSVQGEGYHTGRPAVFVRFGGGCSGKCTFCDTDFSTRSTMSVTHIVDACKALVPHEGLVVLTGGEPTLYDLSDLIIALRSKWTIAIETNGLSLSKNIYEKAGRIPMYVQNLGLNWVTLSPKPVEFHNEGYELSVRCINNASELKFVYDPRMERFDFLSLYAKDEATQYFLKAQMNDLGKQGKLFVQPCSEDHAPAYEFVRKRPWWRLSVQTQKVLHVR